MHESPLGEEVEGEQRLLREIKHALKYIASKMGTAYDLQESGMERSRWSSMGGGGGPPGARLAGRCSSFLESPISLLYQVS